MPIMSPPRRSTSRMVASSVPPVASRSSTISTRSPGAIASVWICSMLVPYLSAYSSESGIAGSCPASEPAPPRPRSRRRSACKDEAATLDDDHLVDPLERRRHRVDGLAKRRAIGQQGGDVAKKNAGDREIRHIANVCFQGFGKGRGVRSGLGHRPIDRGIRRASLVASRRPRGTSVAD